jgi:hypothetical protein
MNKMVFLGLSIVAIVVAAIGSATKSTIATDIGGLAALVTWVLGLIKMVQLKRWGWFVAVLLLTPLTTLLYGIYGPAHPRG